MTRHPVTSSTSFLYCLGRPRVLGRQQMAGGWKGTGPSSLRSHLPEASGDGRVLGQAQRVWGVSRSPSGSVTFGVGEEPLALCGPAERTPETPPWPATVLAF